MKIKKSLLILRSILFLTNCGSKTDSPESVKEVSSRVESLPYYKEATFTPHWLEKNSDLKNFHKIPDFTLINQDGDSITQDTFRDKIYITDFFFTICPGICPVMTENLSLIHI